jgi:hypothetical protein
MGFFLFLLFLAHFVSHTNHLHPAMLEIIIDFLWVTSSLVSLKSTIIYYILLLKIYMMMIMENKEWMEKCFNISNNLAAIETFFFLLNFLGF